jgi:2-polyprenyl-6-methoxyphenol hydroxylase-like FAD-dependent oxidoreductase
MPPKSVIIVSQMLEVKNSPHNYRPHARRPHVPQMTDHSSSQVGGSIAGLLAGLHLKHLGTDVIILEQDPASDRTSHHAGIRCGANVMALLGRHDDTGLGKPSGLAVPSHTTLVAWRRAFPEGLRISWPRNLSSWALVYRVLRANFDGMRSPAVPAPPGPRPEDGITQYWSGKRVTGLKYDKDASDGEGLVHVEFVDVGTGEEGSRSAPVVIAADGRHSTMRRLLGVPTQASYAGYIGWRGTLPEQLLSREALAYFEGRLIVSLMKRQSHVIM